jgi:hypothetical protein
MSEILTHSGAKNASFGFRPRDIKVQAVNLRANKGSNGQADMVALRDFKSVLGTLDTRELFEPLMIELDLPGIQGVESSFFDGHIQTAGRPALCVAVCADCSKYLDPAKPLRCAKRT